MHRFVAGAAVALAALSSPWARELTFEDRVKAQEAIEQVYWKHRIWPRENPQPKPPLGEVMPRRAIREKVEQYLRMSNALEKYWKRPMTVEQLQAELNRMARNSRDPGLLREIFAALGNDPFLAAETLARPNLADHLIRNWYTFDSRFHGDLMRKARAELGACRSVECMRSMGGEYLETTWRLGRTEVDRRARDPRVVPLPDADAIDLDPEEWHEQLTRIARMLGGTATALPVNRLGEIEETSDTFLVTAVISQDSSKITTATVIWPKQEFDNWWTAAGRSVDPIVKPSSATMTLPTIALTGCSAGTWTPTHPDVPEGRVAHSAVWTGSEMIIWGGDYFRTLNTGARYDPSTDTWTATSMGTGVPGPRLAHTAVWTGTEMIVWGGVNFQNSPSTLATGGRFNPSTNMWTPTSVGGDVPEARSGHTAVWTGREMIVWGGVGVLTHFCGTGGRYDPSTDSWESTATGEGAPVGRQAHTAVWTGREMIVWGGVTGTEYENHYLNTGGRYDPTTDSWIQVPATENVPDPRINHTAVWTGSEMLVWGGGYGFDLMDTGGRYNPDTGTWAGIAMDDNAPIARNRHTAIWTGSEMIIWGGYSDQQTTTNTGGRYDPSVDTWAAMSTSSEGMTLSPRLDHTAVWTGSEMIVWGGANGNTRLKAGGRYSPATDSWVPTTTDSGVPTQRERHSAIWTGSEMIVWGGFGPSGFVQSGGRYDPATDSWTPTSTGAGTPGRRADHTAVWTGSTMIVWGGEVGGGSDNAGARYNPATNAWTATSMGADVPGSRTWHTAVWTGSEMVVWGGWYDGASLSTGGRYDPRADVWRPTSMGSEVPSDRYQHTAVWTGSEMIVWGGRSNLLPFYLDSGARYSPATDSWVATSMDVETTPAPRRFHTAVWTGSEMIIWGGSSNEGRFDTGGRYIPSTDTWRLTSTGTGAPSQREKHSAVWTGSEMIVWGGNGGQFNDFPQNTGGRYEPVADSWVATDAGPYLPSVRYNHSAIWTGSEMIVWGGFEGFNSPLPILSLNTGGRYCACPGGSIFYRDADGDGFGDSGTTTPSCSGSIPQGYVADDRDCDDSVPSIHPGGTEVCNGIDDDCNDAIDEGEALLCEDGDLCTDDVCNGTAGCIHAFNSAPCDDGNACSVNDACASGACLAGRLIDPKVDCNDENKCTRDYCDSALGCYHFRVVCDDDNPNTSDRCEPSRGCVFTYGHRLRTPADGGAPRRVDLE